MAAHRWGLPAFHIYIYKKKNTINAHIEYQILPPPTSSRPEFLFFSYTLNGSKPLWEISEQLLFDYNVNDATVMLKGFTQDAVYCTEEEKKIPLCCTLQLTPQLVSSYLCYCIMPFWKYECISSAQELEKAGLLNKTKIAEGGRKLRWGRRAKKTPRKTTNTNNMKSALFLCFDQVVSEHVCGVAGKTGVHPGWCWWGTVWFSSKIPSRRHRPAGWGVISYYVLLFSCDVSQNDNTVGCFWFLVCFSFIKSML